MTPLQTFFSQLTQFFDHVYVITLERATDRHAHIRQELAGLPYSFFFGKDNQSFSILNLEQQGVYNETLARKHHRYGKPMSPGMIGCAWSHVEVYKTILQNSYERVLILEDDVVINQQALNLWPAVVAELPKNWELLYLGFAEKESAPLLAGIKKAVYHLQRRLGGLIYSHRTIQNLYPQKKGNYIWKAGYHDCTHAYGVTRQGAEKLLALQTPISFVADNLLAHAATNEHINAYIIQPKLINQQYQVGTTSVSYLNQ